MEDLAEHLSIIAVTNGRDSGKVFFSYDGDDTYMSAETSPYTISGYDEDGKVKVWEEMRSGDYTIKAWSRDKTNVDEDPEDG